MGVIVTLNGLQATDARITLPAWGVPFADVSLDGEHTLSGAVALVMADLTFKATVLSGGVAVGRSFYRLVGGMGGWSKTLPRTSYSNDAGVKRSTVLGDAAVACGETFDVTTFDATRLGPYFVRAEGQACTLLEQLAPNAWYVGEDGKTRLGSRPKTTLTSTATRTSQVDRARGTVTIASDTLANIVPGIVVDGLEAVDVEHEVSAKDGLRTQIWGRAGIGNSRRLAAFRSILNALDPGRRYRGVYEYRVVTQESERLNLQAVRVSTGMPDIRRVMVRPGVMGAKGRPALGSRVLVVFVDQDPARPVVISFEDAEGAFVPSSVTLDASSSVHIGPSAGAVAVAGSGPAIVRVGDTVNAGYLVLASSPTPGTVVAYFPGTVIGQAAATTAAGALTPPGTVLPLDAGQPTSGSTKGTCG